MTVPTSPPAGHPALRDLAGWNRQINREHGMETCQTHPNPCVRWHERGRQRRIVQAIPRRRAATLADVGCERGFLSPSLAERCDYLVCIDIDHDMLLQTRRLLPGRRVSYVVADAQHLPFRDGWAEVTVSGCVLSHLPDPAQGLREMARITCADGALVINVPNDPWLLGLKRFVFDFLRMGRYFPGLQRGLAPGHIWAFDLTFLRAISRGIVTLERVALNAPFCTNLFVTARPVARHA